MNCSEAPCGNSYKSLSLLTVLLCWTACHPKAGYFWTVTMKLDMCAVSPFIGISFRRGPMPPEMRDTAFMDRLHACTAGWEYPKLSPDEHLTDHFGLVSDFLSECWSRLRSTNRLGAAQGRIHLGGALSGRDIEAVNKTVNGMLKLLFPDPEMDVSDEDLEWIYRLALEARRRVKE